MTLPGPEARLRVALRMPAGRPPAYLGAAARALLEVPGTTLVLCIMARADRADLSVPDRLRHVAERAYEWIERRILRGGVRALRPVAPVPLPAGTHVVSDDEAATVAAALRETAADVLVDLGPRDSPALPVPRHGTWRLAYALGAGAPRVTRPLRPRTSSALIESVLTVEPPDGEPYETDRGVGAVRRVGFSRDRDAILWRSALLPARHLSRLAAGQDAARDRHPAPGSAKETAEAPPPYLGLVAGTAARVLERLAFRHAWTVLVRHGPADGSPPADLTGFRPVEAPPGRFYADPFVVLTDDGPRLYVEDCPIGTHRGRISVLRPGPGDGWSLERVVLEDSEHRAYPHVLRTPRGLVLTPDAGSDDGVDLFVDEGGAVGPRRIGRCLDGVRAADPTLLWHDDRWWLFVAVSGHGMNPWDELHLYGAASLDGPWHPHPRNPIVADVRRSRPAGRIVEHGGTLLRPGQDCSLVYGGRIVWSAIRRLSMTEYEEEPIGSTEPRGAPGVHRTHTYSTEGTVDAIDGYRRTLRRPRLPGGPR